ncbi:uncharacterized protein N7483_006221 [Penicillium malachiteum]|uniref:uncharacterized protein n=1 Tax=Penicillium malachiteum TaxID=1324776 RepID=UPI002547CAD5|nr:uncharacterized protein N7483_006221 [Penicillium malachiteum]KAJ5731713.1 hypothetical protein N7483_006221 [Penicillium malachiteum]
MSEMSKRPGTTPDCGETEMTPASDPCHEMHADYTDSDDIYDDEISGLTEEEIRVLEGKTAELCHE